MRSIDSEPVEVITENILIVILGLLFNSIFSVSFRVKKRTLISRICNDIGYESY